MTESSEIQIVAKAFGSCLAAINEHNEENRGFDSKRYVLRSMIEHIATGEIEGLRDIYSTGMCFV